jgi:hypothetical protein
VRYIRHKDILFNPSTPEGVDNAHVRQAKNRNKNTAGSDDMRQLERGRSNQTRLEDDDSGPSRSAQGSARHGGKPTGVVRYTSNDQGDSPTIPRFDFPRVRFTVIQRAYNCILLYITNFVLL